MLELLADAESAFAPYPNLIAAIAAFSTFAAVVVSLVIAYMSLRESIPRVKAYADISIIMHATIPRGQEPEYVTIDIVNIGNVPVFFSFSFFQISLPWVRKHMMVNPLDAFQTNPLIPQIQYPYEIRPRLSHPFWIGELDEFRKNMARALAKKSWLYKLCFRLARVIVISTDGRKFPVKVSARLQRVFDEVASMSDVERKVAIEL